MTDLIFHIGLPKCGSTTLQREIFSEIPGYLGTSTKDLDRNFAKEFQKVTPTGARLKGNLKRAQLWADEVSKTLEKKFPDVSRYIVSDEFLSQWNKKQYRPIIPFLKDFNENVWTRGQVKVLIILRNQPEKLASSYAQRSISLFGASQKDFQKYIKNINTTRIKYLDYSIWINDLYKTFGQENVCVLFLEEMNSEKFWKDLNNFMQLGYNHNELLIKANTRANVRSKEVDKWDLRPLDITYKSKEIPKKMLDFLWPTYKAPNLRSNVFSTLQKGNELFYTLHPGRIKEKQREDQIVLTNELRDQILEKFKSSNDRLSVLLGKDLKSLGY